MQYHDRKLENSGYVLIIVLIVLASSMAILTTFISDVYVYVNTTENFRESEKMSMVMKAAYTFTSERGRELYARSNYNSFREIPFEENVEDMKLIVLVVDNNSKFNLNSLVFKNGLVNQSAYNVFKRLLKELEIDESYADTVIDYIDADKVSRSSTGELNAKNYFLFSLSELSYIFPKEDLDKLLPYVTFFGDGKININTALYPVLKALHNDISEEVLKRIIERRTEKPFENIGELTKVSGMERVGIEISDMITVKNTSFMIYLKAAKDEFIENIEAGCEIIGDKIVTKYWKEI